MSAALRALWPHSTSPVHTDSAAHMDASDDDLRIRLMHGGPWVFWTLGVAYSIFFLFLWVMWRRVQGRLANGYYDTPQRLDGRDTLPQRNDGEKQERASMGSERSTGSTTRQERRRTRRAMQKKKLSETRQASVASAVNSPLRPASLASSRNDNY